MAKNNKKRPAKPSKPLNKAKVNKGKRTENAPPFTKR